jgi:carboxyl-terminal processing protease
VKRALRSGWPTAGVLAVLVVVLLHQGTLLRVNESGVDELGTIAKVRDYIVDHWVEDPAPRRERLRYGAVEGMAAQLDPYSEFIPPEKKNQFDEDTDGEFGGIGVRINIENGHVVIETPLEDTPAWLAGLLPGDRIETINGEGYEVVTSEDAQKKLRGKPGTAVDLLVSNPLRSAPKTVRIERAVIKAQSVKGTRIVSPLPGDLARETSSSAAVDAPRIGYLHITGFQRPTLDEFDRAIAQLSSDKMTALVLDLRGNPGGYLNAATDIGSRFLERGQTVVLTRGPARFGSSETRTLAEPPADAPRIRVPVAVLLDGGSASASEVLAGALRDNGRATLVGSRSFGKGSVQSIFPIDRDEQHPDGRAKLKLTTNYYYTPALRKIHRVEGMTDKDEWGLLPDLAVALDPKLHADLLRQEDALEIEGLKKRLVPSTKLTEPSKLLRDPQIEAAVDHLGKVLRGEAKLALPQPVTAPSDVAATTTLGRTKRPKPPAPQGSGGG